MRQKICMAGAALFFIISVFMFSAPDAEAVPAFARQTGLSCNTCHFQHYSSLNAFGRLFKAGGFTMVGGQSMIEGDMLSMPSALNASMVLKLRYQKTNGDFYYTKADGSDPSLTKDTDSGRTVVITGDISTNKGELQFPDEAAIFLAGRVGENIGFVLEMALNGENTDNFTSFKMPFVYDFNGTKVSVIPFNTDALGVSFGFELLNTGAVRNIRTLEHRSQTSAQQYIGTATPAEGIAFVAARDIGFVNYSLWVPSHTAKDIGPMSQYLRVAATPTFAGWDIGGGLQWWGGTSSVARRDGFDEDILTSDTDFRTHAWAIDAQAQGEFKSMPLGVYVTYANAEKSESGEPENYFNSGTDGDETALTLVAELGVIPNKAAVSLGYRSADTGASSSNEDNAITIGAIYQMAQNVQIQLNHSSMSGNKYDTKPSSGDQLTTLMLFTAF